MNTKKLRKLNRRELIKLIEIQSRENNMLREQLSEDDSIKYEQEMSLFSEEALQKELERIEYGQKYRSVLKSTIATLIVVAAVAVLVATLFLPVLRIYGESMTPSLIDGEIVFSVKGSQFEQGDIIAFYFNNKILVKRVIAQSGEWVDISPEGVVTVNGAVLDEPYVNELALGECDIELPYQVPDNRIFVMGDHRATSVDSRSKTIGCVAEEEIVGKIVLRVWPLEKWGTEF